MPIARARPIRSPRLPSRMPPIAAPNISAAVNRANQSPPSVGVYRSPSRSLETDSDASGIKPSSKPSNNSPPNAAQRTTMRAGRCSGTTRMTAVLSGETEEDDACGVTGMRLMSHRGRGQGRRGH